jgi:hypothetical protein
MVVVQNQVVPEGHLKVETKRSRRCPKRITRTALPSLQRGYVDPRLGASLLRYKRYIKQRRRLVLSRGQPLTKILRTFYSNIRLGIFNRRAQLYPPCFFLIIATV